MNGDGGVGVREIGQRLERGCSLSATEDNKFAWIRAFVSAVDCNWQRVAPLPLGA
mgnify:CR=1 FL=1